MNPNTKQPEVFWCIKTRDSQRVFLPQVFCCRFCWIYTSALAGVVTVFTLYLTDTLTCSLLTTIHFFFVIIFYVCVWNVVECDAFLYNKIWLSTSTGYDSSKWESCSGIKWMSLLIKSLLWVLRRKKKKTTLINPQTAVLIWWTEQKFLQNQTVFEHLDDS